jgi:hypothetical protein
MTDRTVNLAILGSGGLGRKMVELLTHKSHLRLVAICDSTGAAISEGGLDLDDVLRASAAGTVGTTPRYGRLSGDSIGEIIAAGDIIDAVFVALPNLPNSFIPDVTRRFAEGGYQGVMVDALKRTTAVEMMLGLDGLLKDAAVTYITGAGATPGLLTAAAALAASASPTGTPTAPPSARTSPTCRASTWRGPGP